MLSRQRVYAGFVLLCVLAILATASYLRLDQSSQDLRSQLRDLDAVSRFVYYRVQSEAGPRFRLSGGEASLRLVTHLAVDRSAAWPVTEYRPGLRYTYGLQIELLDPDGRSRWTKTVHISSAVSKGAHKNGVWTQEAAFSETRTFVPTDARVTQIELPSDTLVNSSLQVRLLTPTSSFAMVRAYGLSAKNNSFDWLNQISLSPAEKRELVQGITYLDWDELEHEQREERLSKKVSRLTAASDIRSESKIVPLYLSDYRVLRSPEPPKNDSVLLPSWNESFVVQGPTRLKLTLHFEDKHLVQAESFPHLLHIERVDAKGQRFHSVEPFSPWEQANSHRLEHFIDIPNGEQRLALRWDPPDPGQLRAATLRSRKNSIQVSHARGYEKHLAYTLRDTKDTRLKLSSDAWRSSEVHHDSHIDPLRWRSSYYFVSQETGPLSFLVPAQDENARMFRIKATNWDHAPHQNSQKALQFAFLNEAKQSIDQGRLPLSQDFDRDRWVTIQGTAKGSKLPQPLNIGLGAEQHFSGIAPKGARWIEVQAKAPLLVQVSARIPSYAIALPPPNASKQESEQRKRRWIPMLASQHPHFDQKGWVMSVKATRRYQSSSSSETKAPAHGQAWTSIVPLGRPQLQRILEENPYQESAYGLKTNHSVHASLTDMWQACHNCWVEIPPYQTHRVQDQGELASDPQALWASDLQSTECSFQIDGQRSDFVCPVQREKLRIQGLAGGSHHFRWQSDGHRDRLWLNRSSVPVHGEDLADGPTLYAERTLTRLTKHGQSYEISHLDKQSKYLNFRVYRRLKAQETLEQAMQEPLTVDIELDTGTPARHSGKLYDHFTPSRKQTQLTPVATPEIVFLDSDETGPFQRYEFGFLLGQDIKTGQHRVRIRAMSDETLWVRAFAQGRATRTQSSNIYGRSDSVKSP